MRFKFYGIKKEFYIKEILKFVLLIVAIGKLFFDSFSMGLIIIPFLKSILKNDMKKEYERQRELLMDEYRNAITCMAGNLGAGYSVEKAFVMGIRDADTQSNGQGRLINCVSELENSLECNIPIDEVLSTIAEKTEIEDIKECSELIISAKRYGGNVAYISRQYAASIMSKYQLKNEIKTMTAAKRYEGKIMIFAPFVIIVYMRFSNPEYMSVLYNTVLGKIIMVISLVVMLVVAQLTEKILKIEV